MWIESGDTLVNRQQITYMGVVEYGSNWYVEAHFDDTTSSGRYVSAGYPTKAEALAAMKLIAAGLVAPEPSS